MSLLDIDNVRISPACLLESYEFLQEAGKMDWEAIALWAGHQEGHIFHATEAIIPDQTPIDTGKGLCYVVQGDELFRLNKYLYESQLELIAQLHTHPGAAYHSELDDSYPIITTAGGISIVIPNFASGDLDMSRWATYRLSETGSWDKVSRKAYLELFTLKA